MSEDWIERRVSEAQSAVRGTPNEVPDEVAQTFRALLGEKLQARLKPEELKGVVARLARANNPAAE
jgi:hypothetical protein